MGNPLSTYLNDHAAGAEMAIQMLNDLQEACRGSPAGDAAAEALPQVEEDLAALRAIEERVGATGGGFRKAAARVVQKASRLKLRLDEGSLGAFETLEALSLGILGKAALWRALRELSRTDARLRGPDYEALLDRALRQHDRIDACRLAMAAEVFQPLG